MSVLDLAYDRIDKKLDEMEVTDEYFRGLRAGLIDALELIDILDMELDGRLPAGDDVKEHTLNPSMPTTVREALDLAWELAHEVKEGQVIPEGSRYLAFSSFGMKEYTAQRDIKIGSELGPVTRTLEPLPVPLPDWLDAPAVLAATCWCTDQGIWLPETGGHWKCARCREDRHWSTLVDVTPLYPKEGQDA